MTLTVETPTRAAAPSVPASVAPSVAPSVATGDAPGACTAGVRSGRITINRRLPLRHVGLRDVTISAEWSGNPDGPTVIVAGGISADRHVASSAELPAAGWWEELAGPHRALDTTRFRLVAIDWLGIEGDLDVPLDSADQAAAIVAVLDHLGVERAAAFVGASYGGMVGLQLAAEHPERLGRLVVISAAHRPHPYASAWRGVQRRILALGRVAGAETEALSLARQLAMLSYRTPAEFGDRFAEPATIDGDRVACASDSYLETCGERFVERFHPTAWLRLSESIDLQRLDPATVTVPTVAVAVTEDRLVPAADIAELVARLGGAGELQVLRSPYGHDAFLKEPAAIGRLIRQALRGIEGAAA